MIQDRGDLERCLAPGDRDRRRRARHQQARARLRLQGRNRHRHLERSDTNDSSIGARHVASLVRLTRCRISAAGLLVEMAVDEAGAFDRRAESVSPATQRIDVGEQPCVVRQVLACVAAVDVGRQVRDARAPCSDSTRPGMSVVGWRIQDVSGG